MGRGVSQDSVSRLVPVRESTGRLLGCVYIIIFKAPTPAQQL